IMACAVCRKKVLMGNPLNVLVGIWGILGNFAKVSYCLRLRRLVLIFVNPLYKYFYFNPI
ncbi:hypothetical protein, partial [Neisseria viridiae]|uniref:hypothetical protein n=1 Tax=Neisseria viridiae TaxID=2830648 RepID=UPI00272C747E